MQCTKGNEKFVDLLWIGWADVVVVLWIRAKKISTLAFIDEFRHGLHTY
jgi:hypothetical protein